MTSRNRAPTANRLRKKTICFHIHPYPLEYWRPVSRIYSMGGLGSTGSQQPWLPHHPVAISLVLTSRFQPYCTCPALQNHCITVICCVFLICENGSISVNASAAVIISAMVPNYIARLGTRKGRGLSLAPKNRHDPKKLNGGQPYDTQTSHRKRPLNAYLHRISK